MQENRNIKFCSKCGGKNYTTSTFCSKCGNKIDNIGNFNPRPNANINHMESNASISMNYENNDISKFVSKNIDYYASKFEKIKSTGSKITWNWAAFFFNVYWMLYRKMYVQAGISFLIYLICPIPFVVQIVIGLYANYMYLNHIESSLFDLNHMDYNTKQFMIMKKGGTNILIPLILSIPIQLLSMFIATFILMLFGY